MSQEGLREIVKKTVIESVFKPALEKWPGWMVCVVDDPGMKMTSNVMGMYDLMEHRVTLVDSLWKKRAPYTDMAVIYIVAPTEKTVNRILDDWTPASAEHKTGTTKRMYGNAVFLHFLNRLPDALLSKIKECKPLLKRLKAFGEINIDFVANESRAFHLNMRYCFTDIFVRKNPPTKSEGAIVDKLVTVCVTLNEYPHIRYRGSSPLCANLAQVFHQRIDAFVGSNPSWWYHGDPAHTDKDRSTILIIDRSEDLLSPLMHEFTYQAMVNDLLNIADDKIKYKSETAEKSEGEKSTYKEVLLNDNDELWIELRPKHIADVIQTLSARIRDVMDSNSGASVASSEGKNLSLSDMAAALKALPEYREIMSKLSQHMHISHQCMNIFNKNNMLDLSDLEQTLATGQNDDGHSPKLSELIDRVENEMPNLRPVSKLRLLAILIITQQGLQESDKEKLYSAANLSPLEVKVLGNLEIMGVKLTQVDMSKNKKLGTMFRAQRLAKTGRANSESEYSTSRYICALKTILQDMNAERLSIDDYPSVLPLPPGKSHAAASARTRSARPASRYSASAIKKQAFKGGRQIVFIAGGMCYSELRASTEVMECGEKEFILGSTHLMNPAQFVADLHSLS